MQNRLHSRRVTEHRKNHLYLRRIVLGPVPEDHRMMCPGNTETVIENNNKWKERRLMRSCDRGRGRIESLRKLKA